MADNSRSMNRRKFLKQSAAMVAMLTGVISRGKAWAFPKRGGENKKIIVIGIDGMDPVLTEKMMNTGQLEHLKRMAKSGGYSRLGTSIPPQSPVAWANFINGAGPGSHGIFDFVHRNPEKQYWPFFSAAETVPAQGGWDIGEYELPLAFWPFNDEPAKTLLRRKGVPFWDYLDKAGIKSVFYDLPSNYPPSQSKNGNHRCLSGMGTPDLLGNYGTYQHFAEDGPYRPKDEAGGRRSRLVFKNHTAEAELVGPRNNFLKQPERTVIKFKVHRDLRAGAAAIDIQDSQIVLKEGQWSHWVKLDYEMAMPALIPNEHVSGICRFYLQEVKPNFRLYVSPINTDPSDPAIKITEPEGFIKTIANNLGLFYTTGFQEDHKALSNGIFTDEEYAVQAGYVLQERMNLLDYALKNYDEGLLFFYFSSTDLQSHMFWWDAERAHPTRSRTAAEKAFQHIQKIYRKMDQVVGDIVSRYGKEALIIVLSDHGFANFRRQFGLNTWLRNNGYVKPDDCTSLLQDVQWHTTRAYGLGINGLYLNLKGRERDGIVDPGKERDELLAELTERLEAVRDTDGQRVIKKVYRSDQVYTGQETALAPDLILGFKRGYRASWATCLGDMDDQVLSNNGSAWSADHCADATEVPGILFCNRRIASKTPSLIDIAPTILAQFGLSRPTTMTGRNILDV